MNEHSELAMLVEAENRLDRSIAAARQTAEALRAAAEQRARDAERTFADDLARERTKIATAIATELAERERATEAHAKGAIERYERVRDDVLANLAAELARRLIEEET